MKRHLTSLATYRTVIPLVAWRGRVSRYWQIWKLGPRHQGFLARRKAGTGKLAIVHTLCEILDRKNIFGGSFFCSRGSENARNAGLIVPTIAHSLDSTSPCIRSEVIKAIETVFLMIPSISVVH